MNIKITKFKLKIILYQHNLLKKDIYFILEFLQFIKFLLNQKIVRVYLQQH